MKLYECNNVSQVSNKVAALTNTKPDRECWKHYCDELKQKHYTTDTVDYIAFDVDDNERDITIVLQYDRATKQFLVGME
jgi:hypothetical protein